MPYVARLIVPRRRERNAVVELQAPRRNSRFDEFVTRRSCSRENLADHDVPVDLLRRFSHPAGSSSSAIVVVVFSDCFAVLFSGTLTSNAARRHRAEHRAEYRRGLPTSGIRETLGNFSRRRSDRVITNVKRSNVTSVDRDRSHQTCEVRHERLFRSCVTKFC